MTGDETFILARSADRREKEKAMHERFIERLEELAKSKSRDVVLPTPTRQGHHKDTVRLRCVTEPDEAQKVLLHRLGVTLPRRLRRIDEVLPMEWKLWPENERHGFDSSH